MINTGKIKKLREKKGITQEQIADELGISQPTYARLESGAQKLQIEHLIKIASFYKIPLSDLFCLKEIPVGFQFTSLAYLQNTYPDYTLISTLELGDQSITIYQTLQKECRFRRLWIKKVKMKYRQ